MEKSGYIFLDVHDDDHGQSSGKMNQETESCEESAVGAPRSVEPLDPVDGHADQGGVVVEVIFQEICWFPSVHGPEVFVHDNIESRFTKDFSPSRYHRLPIERRAGA